MVLQAQGKQTPRQIEAEFTGVTLRTDPSDVNEAGLARGINVDLYATPGTLLSRRGMTDKTLGLNAPQRKIVRAGTGVAHAGATSLYIDGVEEISTLSATTAIDMIEFRGQNAQGFEVFIANGDGGFLSGMLRFSPPNIGNWGITPPVAAPVLSAIAAGSLTGTYLARYSYARRLNGITISESNPSPAPSSGQALTAEDLGVSVVASTDPDVTNILIYRTVAGGSVYLLDQIVGNATAVVTSSQIDGGLGAAVDEDNDVPIGATIVHALRDRIWTNDVTVSNRLHYTKRFFPEAQPAANFIDITPETTTITAISSIGGVLIVFTDSTKYRIIEQVSGLTAIGDDIPFIGGATEDFVVFELPSSRGCVAPNAVVSIAPGIIYPTKDGVFLTTGQPSPEQLLSESIQNIFLGIKEGDIPPIDFDNESNMVAETHRGRYYLSYTSTESADGENDYTAILNLATGRWYFWSEGYSAFLFDDTDDEFIAGRKDGSLRLLEQPGITADFAAGDSITALVSTADRDGGDPYSRKMFQYTRVDAEVATGDTLTANFYADDTLKRTFTVTGDRTRLLQRLPVGSRGFTWHMELTFQGTSELKLHGVEAQWKGFSSS